MSEKKVENFFQKKFKKKKIFGLERSQKSIIFVRFRANFGQFRWTFAKVKISGVFDQNVVPKISKISICNLGKSNYG